MDNISLSRLSPSRGLTLLCCFSLIASMMLAALPTVAALNPVQVSVTTNGTSYYDMQTVGLYANLTFNSAPINNGIMAVEIDRPSPSWYPIVFRSIRGSQTPNPALFDSDLQIASITPINVNWIPQTSFRRGDYSYFNVTIVNNGLGRVGLITASIFDLASVPLSAGSYGTRGAPMFINGGTTILRFSLDIPTWAALGTATIYVNIFSESPSIYGAYPIIPEKSATFQIKSAFGPLLQTATYVDTGVVATNTRGAYNFSWRVPPYAVLGDYVAYAAANYTNATPSFDSATFQVVATGTAPQASFTYSPTAPYAGGTTYFDASASFSYNGTITNYRWAWGDGTPQDTTASPFITHKFMTQGTFLVTLNVTDSQNLWCTTQKPVPVSGPTPPVASFTFSPSPTWIDANTTFDGSSSTPGWNGTGSPPIVNYAWNFGDGTPPVNGPNPIVYHQFTALGNFTTILTVSDSRPMSGQTSHVVQVINVTQHPDIAITDLLLWPPAPQPTPNVGVYKIAPDYYEPFKGWSGDVRVTVLNNGTSAANFSVTVYYSNGTSTSLGTHAVVNLPSQSSILLTYPLNTTLMKPTMNYTITANATILLGESNILNNQYNAIMRIKGPGDASGDGLVDIKDVSLIGINWQKFVPPGNPRADVNADGKVNIVDVSIIGANWQKRYI